MNKKAFVTGAGGFIGSHLVESLLNEGWKVRALVRYNSRSNWGWLEEARGRKHLKLEVMLGDITDPFQMKEALAGCNVIFHLLLFLPLMLLQMAALGFGFGIIVSSLTTKYHDLTHLVGFGVQLWMYATPIVYPASQIPERWQWVIMLNPMSPVIEGFRYAFLGSGTIHPWQMGLGLGTTLVILTIGIVLFSRIEKSFMDTV